MLFNSIDYVGFRSFAIKRSYERFYKDHLSFLCPSGIPPRFISFKSKTFSGEMLRFIYVGNLIARKHPFSLIRALSISYKDKNFELTYVGSGREENKIQKFIKRKGLTANVFFTGRLERDEILKFLDASDIFIMISEDETFGLVYLEAMARGCIVVASKDEGMDGIIEDGVNGFLCKAGDEDELSSIIKKIESLTRLEKIRISENALKTAQNFTDEIVARNYIMQLSN